MKIALFSASFVFIFVGAVIFGILYLIYGVFCVGFYIFSAIKEAEEKKYKEMMERVSPPCVDYTEDDEKSDDLQQKNP